MLTYGDPKDRAQGRLTVTNSPFQLAYQTILIGLLCLGCATKTTQAPPTGATVSTDAPEKVAKDPNPGPAPDLSLTNSEDLWPLLRSGYFVSAVTGSVLSEEPTPNFGNPTPPPELKAVHELLSAQAKSPEATMVEAILRDEYALSGIVPATSHPISELTVAIQISGPDSDANRRVRVQLQVSYQMRSKTGEAESVLPQATGDQEPYDLFKASASAALAAAFQALESEPSPSLPF
jgi:hypothetical protein